MKTENEINKRIEEAKVRLLKNHNYSDTRRGITIINTLNWVLGKSTKLNLYSLEIGVPLKKRAKINGN
jgi:hypothetical protein